MFPFPSKFRPGEGARGLALRARGVVWEREGFATRFSPRPLTLNNGALLTRFLAHVGPVPPALSRSSRGRLLRRLRSTFNALFFPLSCYVLALEDAVAADLGAGAALGPAVGLVTVGPNPAPAHALGLAPHPSPDLPGDPSQSPRLCPDPGPDQDLGLDLEALHLHQRGNPTPDPGLRALPSLRKKKELYPPRKMVMYLGISTPCMLLYCSTSVGCWVVFSINSLNQVDPNGARC